MRIWKSKELSWKDWSMNTESNKEESKKNRKRTEDAWRNKEERTSNGKKGIEGRSSREEKRAKGIVRKSRESQEKTKFAWTVVDFKYFIIFRGLVEFLKESEAIRMHMAKMLRECPRGWQDSLRDAAARLRVVTDEMRSGQRLIIES